MTGLEFKAIAYVMAYTGTSFTTAKVIVYGATLLTAGYVGSRIAEQKAKEMQARMRQQAQNRAIEVQNMQFGTSAPRRFIYGETQVNGHLIFQETAGSSNKDLYRVVYLGEGPINNAQDVYFDDKHTLSQSNNLISSAGVNYTAGTYANHFSAKVYLDGGTTDDALGLITNTSWTNTCKMTGNATFVYKMKHNNEIWTSGIPQIRTRVEGRKLYDPRLDGSSVGGGTGTHRYDDDSTWAYSNNSALCILDFLINAMKVDVEDIDFESFRDMADICDENVTIDDADGNSTTQKRYTTNGVAFMDEEVISTLESLLAPCHGTLVEEGGVIRLLVPKDSSTTVVGLTEDDFVSEINININSEVSNRINKVGGTFTDKENNYQQVDFDPISSSAQITKDGRTHLQLINLSFVTDEARAQRLASIALKENLLTNTIETVLKPKFSYLRVGDVVTVQFAPETLADVGTDTIVSTSTKWRVSSYRLTPESAVRVTLEEYADASYSWDTADHSYLTRTALANSFIDTIPKPTFGTPVKENYLDESGKQVFAVRVPITHGSHPNFVYTKVNLNRAIYDSTNSIRRREQVQTIFVGEGEDNFVFTNLSLQTPIGSASGDYVKYSIDATTIVEGGKRSGARQLDESTLAAYVGVDSTAPAAPSSLAATGGLNQVTLTWTNSTEIDFDLVRLYRSVDSNVSNSTFIGEVRGTTFIDAGLADNTIYYYWASSVDKVQNEGNKTSSSANATTDAAPPKGQKGEEGDATKGQKGEEGVATKGQKGEEGVGTKGQKGELGVKGEKGVPVQYGLLQYDDRYDAGTGTYANFVNLGNGSGDYSFFRATGTVTLDQGTLRANATNVYSVNNQTTNYATHLAILEYDENGDTSQANFDSIATIVPNLSTIAFAYDEQIAEYLVTSKIGTLTVNSQTCHVFAISFQSGNFTFTSTADNEPVTIEINYQIRGRRGAGRWNIGVTTLPTSDATAQSAWDADDGVPSEPVNRDQAWFYQGTQANPTAQTVWIYDGNAWNEQEEVIDGDLIVAGTISSNAMDVGAIVTNAISGGAVRAEKIEDDAATTSKILINSPLAFNNTTSAILGGRTGLSDFDEDGFYIGRTSSDGSTVDGFQLSHTSSDSNNDIFGIVHDPSNGFQILNPTFRVNGGTATANTVITTQSATHTLVKGKSHTFSVIGGGGGGGGASNEHSAKAGTYHGTAGSAGTSTVVNLTGASGYSGTTSWTATGGSGGARGEDNTNHWNRGGGTTANGGTGQSSGFGGGGAGGAGVAISLGTDRNGNDGSNAASTSYGAGGGGGSSASNTNVNEIWWGNPGSGGDAGQVVQVTIDLTNATTDGTLTLTTKGSGGSGGAGYGPLDGTTSGDGGNGAAGALVINSELDKYGSFTLQDLLVPIKQDSPVSTGGITISSFTDNGTNHSILGPFTEDMYFRLQGSLNAGYSWQSETWGFILYSSSPSTSTSWANTQSASGGSANYSYSSITTGFTTPTSSLSYPPSTTAAGTLIRYVTLNRAYVGLTIDVTGFLKAGDEIRHVGEWNSVPPYPTNLKYYNYNLGA